MCEANVYILRNGTEELLLESVDLMEPMEDGRLHLMNLAGEQKTIAGRIREVRLVDHKILLELL